MNRSLFRPRIHAPLAAVTVAAFAGWLAGTGGSPGWSDASDRGYLLASGWAAFAAMAVCLLYVPRKYAYKTLARLRAAGDAIARTREGARVAAIIRRLRLSGDGDRPRRPEVEPFQLAGEEWSAGRIDRARRLRDRQARLESAEDDLVKVRVDVEKGRLSSRRDVRRAVHEVLGTHGVRDLVRSAIRRGDASAGDPPWTVALRPREPLRRMGPWLHAHLWWGLAFAALVFLHGGGSTASLLGAALNVLSLVVVITGLAGIVVFAAGPSRLARLEERLGIGYEQAAVLDEHASRKIDDLLREDAGAVAAAAGGSMTSRRAGGVAPAAALAVKTEDPALAGKLRDLAVLCAQRRRYRERGAVLRRFRSRLHLWRAIHVPATVLLTALVVLHVLSVWWY